MSLEIKGKLIEKLKIESGEGRNGQWKKQSFVTETNEQYPKKICIMLWGDKIEMLNSIEINETVKVSINIESREYNGRWYTDVKAWRIEKDEKLPSVPEDAPPLEENNMLPFDEEINDLPF